MRQVRACSSFAKWMGWPIKRHLIWIRGLTPHVSNMQTKENGPALLLARFFVLGV